MPRIHRSALMAPRTLCVPAALLVIATTACDSRPTRPNEPPHVTPLPAAGSVAGPRVLHPNGAGGPVITLYSGVEGDSVLRAMAAELESLGDERSKLQLRELREHIVDQSTHAAEGARPRAERPDRMLIPTEDGGSTTLPPPLAKIIGTPKVGLLLRDDVAIGTITATIQGTHLFGKMHLEATSQVPGFEVPRNEFENSVLNPAVLDCLNYNISCDLIGTAQLVADLRGLNTCGMKVTFGGSIQSRVSAFGISVSLYGKMSWSPGYLSISGWTGVPDVVRESERCTPPQVHFSLQGRSGIYDGGTLYDTTSSVGYYLILNGSYTKPGNTPNVSWEWYVDGVRTYLGEYAKHTPTDGMHTYEYRVRNKAGLEGRASAKAIRIDPPADSTTTTTTDSSNTGGGGGTDPAEGGGAGEICYDWYWYYPDTGETEFIGETCGDEPPPSEVNQMSRMPSASGQLSFGVAGNAGTLGGLPSKGGGPWTGTVTLVLTDRVPAGSHAAMYLPGGRVDGAYLLVSPDATPKELAGAMEGARRQVGRRFSSSTLANPVRFDPDFTWIEPRTPALGRMLSDLRRAPVTMLDGFGSVRTLVVPIGK